MDLSEFLLARIAEDEEAARAATAAHPGRWTWDEAHAGNVESDGHYSVIYSDSTDEESTPHILRWQPLRVLAECEAKRRIVEGSVPNDDLTWPGGAAGADAEQVRVMLLLALPYADHPDYRAGWALESVV